MRQELDVSVLKNCSGKWGLPLFLLKAPWILCAWRIRGITDIHLHDASLCILMWPWLYLFPRITCTVHGLDAVYPHPAYQLLLRLCRKPVDLFLPISDSTLESCIAQGFKAEKLHLMPDGIFPTQLDTPPDKIALRISLAEMPENEARDSFVILLAGRVIPRKGLVWFLQNVAPSLHPSIRIWVVGRGPQEEEARQVAHEQGLPAHFFSGVSDDILLNIRLASDLFIMPNIHVEGDKEGFGLVSLEANDAGLWVLAADTDGIPSAVHDGKNGHLIEAGNPQAWIEAINTISAKPSGEVTELGANARRYMQRTFSWEQLAQRWRREIFKC